MGCCPGAPLRPGGSRTGDAPEIADLVSLATDRQAALCQHQRLHSVCGLTYLGGKPQAAFDISATLGQTAAMCILQRARRYLSPAAFGSKHVCSVNSEDPFSLQSWTQALRTQRLEASSFAPPNRPFHRSDLGVSVFDPAVHCLL